MSTPNPTAEAVPHPGMPERPDDARRPVPRVATWRVLVVDDDPDVHDATVFALARVRILDRPIELIHVHSADAAFEAVVADPEIAVALVDVVMETDTAGLHLVERLRAAGHHAVRIVLRTGQPGHAPEIEVLERYDIHAYGHKADLDRTKLISLLTTSIRAFRDLLRIEEHRRGLEIIVASTAQLFDRRELTRFAPVVLSRLAALLGVPSSGFVAASARALGEPRLGDFTIVSDAGSFEGTMGANLVEIADDEIIGAFARCGQRPAVRIGSGHLAFRLRGSARRQLFVFLGCPSLPSDAILALVDVFMTNVAICFENLDLVQELDALAFVDPTIETPNENAFERALQERFETNGTPVTVGLVSIEDLMSAASVFGTQHTNQMLALLYGRLWSVVPGLIAAARVGDDTFAFVTNAVTVADATLEALSSWCYADGDTRIHVTGTVALVGVERPDLTPSAVMQRARSTLAFGRRRHRGRHVWFDPSILAAVHGHVKLQTALARALSTGEGLDVHVQPIVDAVTQRLVSGEALARWTLEGRSVSPGRFIPVAEAGGLTFELLRHVIATIGRWASARRAADLPPVQISVNVAVGDIERPRFAEHVLEIVAHHALTPDDLSFEVTEGGVIRDPEHMVGELGKLASAGFPIALDDFGTGQSSLAQVERLPIHTLKIDRAFVTALTPANARNSIAAATISLARGLGLSVVAEGIETVHQHQALVFLGCDRCQGYLYGRPIPIDTFEQPIAEMAAMQRTP